jgi:hypothetical protein
MRLIALPKAVARHSACEDLLDGAQHSAIGDLFSDQGCEFVVIDRLKNGP